MEALVTRRGFSACPLDMKSSLCAVLVIIVSTFQSFGEEERDITYFVLGHEF